MPTTAREHDDVERAPRMHYRHGARRAARMNAGFLIRSDPRPADRGLRGVSGGRTSRRAPVLVKRAILVRMSEKPENFGEPVLVSACLLGQQCRYDGRSNRDGELERDLAARGLRPIAFCPEEHGGLGTPRPPASIEEQNASAVVDGTARVITDAGVDVTGEFMIGAEGALATCRAHGIRSAFLKERSPSCGVCQTHVAGKLVDGPGVTSELLARNGIDVHGVEGRRE
jgi:uncharacterized protein YbbK (DUF523 family)